MTNQTDFALAARVLKDAREKVDRLRAQYQGLLSTANELRDKQLLPALEDEKRARVNFESALDAI